MAISCLQIILFTSIFFRLIQSWLLKGDPQFYHYYQTTKYTLVKRKSDNQQMIKESTTEPSISEPSIITETKFPNTLFNNGPERDKSLPFPLNPVPMLKPNPFAFFIADDKIKQLYTATDNSLSPNEAKRGDEGSFCQRSFDGQSGYCLLAYQCLHVVKEYREHGIHIDICTYHKNVPIICCPLTQKRVGDRRLSARKCLEYHDSLKGIQIGGARTFSKKLCVSSVPMIVNGEVTRHGEYPHMTALGWTQEDGEVKWDCGGTLISELFVLTAAHCATSNDVPPDLVRLGADDLNRPGQQHQDIKILIIIVHPKYTFSSYYHDIALLKLIRRAHFSEFVRPACLWQLPDMDVHTAIATGWGRTEFSGPKSNKLRKVNLDLIEPKVCKNLYRKERHLPRGIIDEQFCAGNLTGGKDTCQGDSGGPLHVELPEYNCVKFVIGITSFGKFCATPNAPGVYTKIHPYLDWIEKNVFGK